MQAETTDSALVESVDDFFAKAGPLPASMEDLRRHPRFYYRACAEATIHPLGPIRQKSEAQCFLVTRDLSRGGLSLMHNEQLFPGQRLDIVLNGEPSRPAVVVWCRRVAAKRYLAGCRFMKGQDET
jgi:PilZ domain